MPNIEQVTGKNTGQDTSQDGPDQAGEQASGSRRKVKLTEAGRELEIENALKQFNTAYQGLAKLSMSTNVLLSKDEVKEQELIDKREEVLGAYNAIESAFKRLERIEKYEISRQVGEEFQRFQTESMNLCKMLSEEIKEYVIKRKSQRSQKSSVAHSEVHPKVAKVKGQ